MKAALIDAMVVAVAMVPLIPAAEPPRPSPLLPTIGEGRGSEFRVIAPPLPAGTHHAVTAQGARLSGIIASSGHPSFSKMPTIPAGPRPPHAVPGIRIENPGLRFERR
ncbi:hypothetical protein [Verrucomicrobium spinosum]|uniref:hypothetical protein n=1 Tax=Verrucomicrobium spinosum TaxID=2736 RepID=UPI0001744DC9|nr:hypothetical protein [Verrucomicrobium spinosum]